MNKLAALVFMLSACCFAADEPIRIMPLGDSITAGYTDNSKWAHPYEFGYRSGLYRRLKEAGYDFVFVGDSPEPFDNKFGDPTHGGTVLPKLDLRKVGQGGHRGYGGWRTPGIHKNIAGWMKQDRPDIILLLIGINGINPNSPKQLDALVKTIYDTDKDVKLIVAQITPLKTFNQNLLNYNTYIRETLVPSYKKRGYSISTVDLYKHFLKNPDDPKSIDIERLSNRINHPTNKLYDKMAESWFEGIEAISGADPLGAAHWITMPEKWQPGKGLPVFRKTFVVPGALKGAMVNVSGLGHYELFLNGHKVGDRFLAPAWSVYEKTVYYNTYDITDLLKKGQNEFRIMLGKGFYNTQGDRRVHGVKNTGNLMTILEAGLEYADGKKDVVITDDTWEAGSGPIKHCAILAGSDYDARDADPASWGKAVNTECPGKLRAAESPGMKTFDRLLPVKQAEEPEPGVFVYDFGQNLSAVPSIRVRGQKGQVLRITPAEQRHKQTDRHNNGTGRVNQAGVGKPNYYEYTLNGQGVESWQPQFTYGGFQYLEVTGAVPKGRPNPGNLPVIEEIQSVHVRAAVREVGAFACSSPLFEKIDRVIDRAVRSNLAHVLTDCPTREKLGWLEVSYLMGPSISRRYDLSSLYAKVTRDIRESQGDDGVVYTVAPNYPRFKGGFRYTPEWGAAGVVVPWQLYRWYGDKRVLAENLKSMKAFVDYMKNTGKDLVPAAGLGDWYDYGHGKGSGPAKFTPPELTAMATFYRCTVIVAKTAEVLGRKDDAKTYSALADAIRKKFNQAFYVGNGIYKNNGSPQTANAMALVTGLCEAENEQAVLNAILADLKQRDYQQTAGDVGFHYLVEALGRYGCNETVCRILNRHDEGSYGFIVDRGWTSLPEAWDANTRASMNHCMLGHIQQWFYCDVLGIRQAEDSIAFRKMIIKPAFDTDLKWARGHYDSVNGRVSVDWSRNKNQLILKVAVPANTSAMVCMPAKDAASVTESGEAIEKVSGVSFLRMEDGMAVLSVEAGNYSFLSRK